ncbi:MAG: hypothetical protein IME93_01640 [Proteobacteria bacterium]|nr:hypothetical protein [Pseudomonadota bacterium]
MKTLKHAVVTLAAAASLGGLPNAHAATDIDQISNLVTVLGLAQAQDAYLLLSEDLGGAIAYRSVSPAESLGITGFDLGIEVTNSKMQNSADWIAAISTGKELDSILMPRVHLHKGLPLGIDIGAFYVGSSNSNIDVTGAELRYALIDGGVAKPAIGVRLTYSKLSGIDEIDMSTQGAELAISKGFTFLTPYAAIGKVRVTSTPGGAAETAGLVEEEFTLNRTNVGLNMNFTLMNLVLDYDKTGDVESSTLKFGFRW